MEIYPQIFSNKVNLLNLFFLKKLSVYTILLCLDIYIKSLKNGFKRITLYILYMYKIYLCMYTYICIKYIKYTYV